MTLQQIHFLQEIRPDRSFMKFSSYMYTCVMIGQIFALLCQKMIAFEEIWGPTFGEQPDESSLRSLTQKVRHDWSISHVAMRGSDTFHLNGTLAQKITETPIGWSLSPHRWQVTWPIGFMWYLGQTIVIVEGLVGKSKHYACYKNLHVFLDLIWKFKVWKSEMSAQ